MEGKYFPGFGVPVPHPPSKPPDPKPPALSDKCKDPPKRTCPVNEQKGIYSDIITTFKLQVKAQDLQILTDMLSWSPCKTQSFSLL